MQGESEAKKSESKSEEISAKIDDETAQRGFRLASEFSEVKLLVTGLSKDLDNKKLIKFTAAENHIITQISVKLQEIQKLLFDDNLTSYYIVTELNNLINSFDKIIDALEYEKQRIFRSNADAFRNLKKQWIDTKAEHDEFYENLIKGKFKYYPALASDILKKIQAQHNRLSKWDREEGREAKREIIILPDECYYNGDEGWKTEKIKIWWQGMQILKDPVFKEEKEENSRIVHIRGGYRDKQEDRHVTYQLEPNLSEVQAIEVMFKAVAEAQQKIENAMSKLGCRAGSTLSAALLFPNKKVITTNLGDSRAYVVQMKGGKACLIPLSRDHRPDDPQEKVRIEKCGGIIKNNRVNGSIAIARAFGSDYSFRLGKKVIDGSHTPEITSYSLQKEDQLLLQICDGVTDVLSDEEMELIIEDCYKKGCPNKIAETLAKAALKKESTDNISVITTDLTAAYGKPQLITLLDGCGGPEVAEFISKDKYFGKIVNDNAKKIAARDTSLKDNKKKPPAKAVHSPSFTCHSSDQLDLEKGDKVIG